MFRINSLIENTKSSKEIYKGKLLHVFCDEVVLPNQEASTREWIKHPGACAIVPCFENGDIMMIKQFRYPMKQVLWEVPAGKIDATESPETTASRELLEETGLIAKNIHYVGHFYPAIGYSDEIIHIYVALNLTQTTQQTDDDEFVQNVRLPISQAITMIETGEINDGKSIVCLLRTQQWLRQQSFSFS